MKEIPAVSPLIFVQEAKDLWYLLCANLMSNGLLTVVGVHQLEMYILKYQMYCRVAKVIAVPEFQVTYIGPHGEVKINPIIKDCMNIMESMAKDSQRWAFDPSSAAALAAPLRDNNLPKGSTGQDDPFGIEEEE